MLGEHGLQIETRQCVGTEIGRGDDPSVADITGKADRDSLEAAERRSNLVDGVNEILGGDRFRRRGHTLPFADQAAGFVEQRRLYPGPADIDRERAGFVHGSWFPVKTGRASEVPSAAGSAFGQAYLYAILRGIAERDGNWSAREKNVGDRRPGGAAAPGG